MMRRVVGLNTLMKSSPSVPRQLPCSCRGETHRPAPAPDPGPDRPANARGSARRWPDSVTSATLRRASTSRDEPMQHAVRRVRLRASRRRRGWSRRRRARPSRRYRPRRRIRASFGAPVAITSVACGDDFGLDTAARDRAQKIAVVVDQELAADGLRRRAPGLNARWQARRRGLRPASRARWREGMGLVRSWRRAFLRLGS